MSSKFALAILGLSLTLSGCGYLSGEITDATQRKTVLSQSTSVGIIPGSQQNMVVSGYKVSVSLGSYTQDQDYVHSSGYKVNSGVQGNNNSKPIATEIISQ